MRDPFSRGGRWPAVKPADVVRVDFVHGRKLPPLGHYDLAAGIPEHKPESFADIILAVFLLGVMVSACGVAAAEGTLGIREAAIWGGGVVVGFCLRMYVGSKE